MAQVWFFVSGTSSPILIGPMYGLFFTVYELDCLPILYFINGVRIVDTQGGMETDQLL